jgi:Uma2 family endonuclease
MEEAITKDKRLTFTVEDLPKLIQASILDSDTRIELIEGEIFFMSPINYSHAYCVNVLTGFFGKHLSDEYTLSVQNPIMLNPSNLLEPDLAIYESASLRHRKQHPTPDMAKLIIEVAGSSYQKDRDQKLPLYARAGITQVWIINLAKRVVEVYTNPTDQEYASVNLYFEHQHVPSSLGFNVHVASLFLIE